MVTIIIEEKITHKITHLQERIHTSTKSKIVQNPVIPKVVTWHIPFNSFRISSVKFSKKYTPQSIPKNGSRFMATSPSISYTRPRINLNMLTSEAIMKTLNQHRKEIQQYGVRRIGLFGSFGANNQHQKSDIDILVEFKRGEKTFDNYMELKFFLEKSFRRPVDLVVKEAVKLELKPSILKSVRYATGF